MVSVRHSAPIGRSAIAGGTIGGGRKRAGRVVIAVTIPRAAMTLIAADRRDVRAHEAERVFRAG